VRERLHRWDEAIARCEKALVAVMLSLMIVLALLQVLLRNAFATGISWGDPLVRNLVLWVGFIGATMATKEGKHINLDVVSRWIGEGRLWLVRALVHFLSVGICAILVYAALLFVANEARSGAVTFLDVPMWVPELVIPVTFGLMTLRFGLAFLEALALRGSSESPDRRPGVA
jgi:C4-dicarboxylate transporter DctQ subunit